MKEQTAVEYFGSELSGHLGPSNGKELFEIFERAKTIEKQQLEKELNRFFIYFRNNGERLLGASIEQLVKSYLKSR
jgi:hypothetical protein